MAAPELNRRSGDPSDIRRVFTEGDDERDAGLEVPDGLKCTYDIPYGRDATWNVLDVYVPAGAPTPLPIIVSVHGGAWVYGDKERYRFYCMDLATRGFCVVNFSYRLAPEHPYPSAPIDACSALAWTLEHGGEFGGDVSNLFIVGDSAGAQIASQVLAAATNPAYATIAPFEVPEGLAVRACGLNCGAYDLRAQLADVGSPVEEFYLHGQDRPDAELDVVDAIGADFPPAFILTAPRDFLRKENLALARRLDALGVECKLHDEQEDRAHVFHLNMRDDVARRVNDEECSFFKKHVIAG